jgi:pantetheine-phosphate adenylyltransferase
MKEAIYPGSFDPITYGHIDILKRAKRIFDVVHIAILQNNKKNSMFTTRERIDQISAIFDGDTGVTVTGFNGLLVDFAAKKGVYTIIRGLRAVSDFENEFQMSLTSRKLNQDVDTVFLMTDEKYSFLSSSTVKEINQFNGDVGQFVPEIVKRAMEGRSINE